jgi:hypothetical protein
MTTQTARPATENQISTLVDMLTDLAEFDVDVARETWLGLNYHTRNGSLTFHLVSNTMDDISARLREARAARKAQQAAPAQDRPEVPSGRYAVDTEEGHLAFYQVRNYKGRYYVSVQASDEIHELPWKTGLAVLRKIEADGVKEAMIRYGEKLEICGRCGRTLTKEESRTAGIGPVCRAKMGF